MSKKVNRIGKKYITNESYEIEIIDYFGWDNCTIKFEDGVIVENLSYDHIKRGKVKNPNHKSVYSVGFYGQCSYKPKVKEVNTKCYTCWQSMLQRCYDKKQQERYPTYKDVTVCEEWHNFQNFAEWFYENYTEYFVLDKDILVKGNKIYSPETCCFVPSEINLLFVKNDSKRGDCPIGVHKYGNNRYRARIKKIHLGYYNTKEEAFISYKTAKEQNIKQKADKWKDLIDLRVYEAMYNYQVEIND